MFLLILVGGLVRINWNVLLKNLEVFKIFWKWWDIGIKGYKWFVIYIIFEYRDKYGYIIIIINLVKNFWISVYYNRWLFINKDKKL